MIRIYLDWNVISSLKRPEFSNIKDFIIKHKKQLLFPYTPAHFMDLMKSYTPNNKFFEEDLETLGFLSDKHLLRWEKDRVNPLFATPKDYFESEKNQENFYEEFDMENLLQDLNESFSDVGLDKIGDLMKSLLQSQPCGIDLTKDNAKIIGNMFPNLRSNSTMWDLFKEIGPFSKKFIQDRQYYKDFRKMIGDTGFKLESNSGNWSYDEVIKNIDDFLLKLGTNKTYLEYIESMFNNRNESANNYSFYTTAYLMLDMIGYKMDKLPKATNNMLNIQADAMHSFYGSYCDYFIAKDNNLRIKSKVLYNEFNIETKIIEPNELISELTGIIDNVEDKNYFLDEAIMFCNKEAHSKSYIPKNGGENGSSTKVVCR